jgi:hypothetical protein
MGYPVLLGKRVVFSTSMASLVALLLVGGAAHAQTLSSATPNAAAPSRLSSGYLPSMPGSGLKLSDDGRTVLHLGADLGVGFDTNPYAVPFDNNSSATGDIVLRLRPRAALDVDGSLLSFRGTAWLDWGALPGALIETTRSFLLYQSLISGDLELNRGGMFSLAVGDTLSWNNDPGITSIGTLLNRIHNQLRAGLGFKPGGGTLSFRLSYAFDFLKYLDVPFDNAINGLIAKGELDTIANTLSLRADYRFLPKTGFFAMLSGGWQTYPFAVGQQDAFPVSLLVGAQGQILPRLAGLVSVGYSNPLILSGAGIETATLVGVVGQAELQWSPTATTQLAGGFQRTFAPVALYQFAGNNRAYVSFNQILLSRFALNVGASYSYFQFGSELPGPLEDITDRSDFTGGDSAAGLRRDGQLDGSVRLGYYFTDWFSVGITNHLIYRHTNANTADSAPLNLGYLRNETMFVASLWY